MATELLRNVGIALGNTSHSWLASGGEQSPADVSRGTGQSYTVCPVPALTSAGISMVLVEFGKN